MMISARSPKTSRRHVAKVAMSNAYDVNTTGDGKQQSSQSDINTSVSNANAFMNESEYYEMDQGSTDHYQSKHNFELNSNGSEKTNREDSGITMTGSASVSNQNFKSGGKLYKKHHHQLVHDSQSGVGFLPKPDTSTLIKNIDKKLQAADTIFIVSKHGRSKLVKKTPNKIKTNVNADLLADSATNSLNNSNTSLNALTTLEQANNAAFVARKAARYFDQSESFDTFNENDYYTKSIGDVVGGGGGGKIYKSKFNSKSTVIFDESSSNMPSYGIGGGGGGKVVPEASFLRAKDLYRKYKEKVNYKKLL